MSQDTDVRTSRRRTAAFALWLITVLAMAAWFLVALVGWVVGANGGVQLLVAILGLATAYLAGEARTFWPDAVRTRRLLTAVVVLLFVVWLLVAGSS